MARVSRNEMEKARRDRLNRLIEDLAKANPIIFNANRKLDKSSILRLTVNFLRVHHDLSTIKQHSWRPNFLDEDQLGSALLSTVGGFLFIVSEKLVLHFATSALTSMLGHNLVDVLEHPVSKIVHSEDLETLKRQFAKGHSPHPEDPPMSSELFRKGRRSFYLRMANHCNRQVAKYDNVHLVGHLKEFPAVQSAFSPPDHETIGEICLIAIGKLEPSNPVRDLVPSVFDAAPQQWITRHDLDGKITYSDQRASWFTGFFPTESIGIPVYTILHPEDIRGVVAAHNRFLKLGKVPTTVFRMLTKNLDTLYIKTNTHLVVDMWTKQNKYIISINEVVVPEEAKKLFEKRDEILPQIEAEGGGPSIVELPDSDGEAPEDVTANGFPCHSVPSPASSSSSRITIDTIDTIDSSELKKLYDPEVRFERESDETAIVYVHNRKYRIRMGSNRSRTGVGMMGTAPHMDQQGRPAKEIPTVMPQFVGQRDTGYREGTDSDFSPMSSPVDVNWPSQQWRSQRSSISSTAGDLTDISISPGPSPAGMSSPQDLHGFNSQFSGLAPFHPQGLSPGHPPISSPGWGQELMSPQSTTSSISSTNSRATLTNGNKPNHGARQLSLDEPKAKRPRPGNTGESATQVDTSRENNPKLLELLSRKPENTTSVRMRRPSEEHPNLVHNNKSCLPNGGNPGPPQGKANDTMPQIQQKLSQQLWGRQEELSRKIKEQQQDLEQIQNQLTQIKDFGGDPSYQIERVTELEMERGNQEECLMNLKEEYRRITQTLQTERSHRPPPTSTVSVPPPDPTPVNTALQLDMNVVSSGPGPAAYDPNPSSSIAIDTGQNQSLLMSMESYNPTMNWSTGASQPHARMQVTGQQTQYSGVAHHNPPNYSFQPSSGIQGQSDMPFHPSSAKNNQSHMSYSSVQGQTEMYASAAVDSHCNYQTLSGNQSKSLTHNQSHGLLSIVPSSGESMHITNYNQGMGVAQAFPSQQDVPLDPGFLSQHEQHLLQHHPQQFGDMGSGDTPLPTLDGPDTENVLNMVDLNNQQVDMTDLFLSHSMGNSGVSSQGHGNQL